jgi:OmpA-OmpF porin, OOP family
VKFKRSIFLLACIAIGLAANGAWAEMPKADTIRGAKDHPLLSRFSGSMLVGYSAKEFDEVDLVAGKQVEKDNKRVFEKTLRAEGKFTRIAYNYPPERASLEVMRNYQAAMQKAGLKTIFACEKEACGKDFGELMLDRINRDFRIEDTSRYWEPFNYGRVEPRYLLASGTRSDGSLAYAAVYVVAPIEGRNGGVYLEIVEPKPMETEKVSASLNADDMAKGLAAEGKIALYGIYFDTDKADIKPESAATLTEMAKLLRNDTKLSVYIVGHTDNQGAPARNLDLSKRRAEAVAKTLATEYKIDPKRLAAKGVASFAPVASNDSDTGRAKNRRVELVKQ